MPSAVRILILAGGILAFTACNKKPDNQAAANSDLSIDGNLAAGQLSANAEIETLPPDESSVDTSGELNSGEDRPDVNEPGNSH
jgi:hypothetical protein